MLPLSTPPPLRVELIPPQCVAAALTAANTLAAQSGRACSCPSAGGAAATLNLLTSPQQQARRSGSGETSSFFVVSQKQLTFQQPKSMSLMMSMYATFGRKPPKPPRTAPAAPLHVPVFIYDSDPHIPPRELKPISLFSVPYRGTPKYNTRRRLTNPILRRRSLSQSSICSAQSDRYQAPQTLRHHPQMGMASPSPSCLTMCPSNSSEYGTLRRFAPDAVPPSPRAGFE